uniref:hypothetical protein n=1 Tax=Leisingera sp. TaxID=1879318 RepID=UPI002B277084
LGGGAMQKMLPLQKILAGFRKAAVEPPWRAAFNAAVSTRGRGAAGFSDATRGGRVARSIAWRRRSAQAGNRGVGIGQASWLYGDLNRLMALVLVLQVGPTALVAGSFGTDFVSFEGHAPGLAGLGNLTTTTIRVAGMPDWPQAVSRTAAIGLPVFGARIMQQPSLFLAAPWGVVLERWFRR